MRSKPTEALEYEAPPSVDVLPPATAIVFLIGLAAMMLIPAALLILIATW